MTQGHNTQPGGRGQALLLGKIKLVEIVKVNRAEHLKKVFRAIPCSF